MSSSKVIGDWTGGVKGWASSDPWEQGWQDYLYQVVNTNTNLPQWGSCGKITLPPVPEVAGASGPYLYLKDCGEFDTQKYQYDLGYLHYAFGLPVGAKGADANNFIDDILINTVGVVPGGGKAAQSGSATGNANGLHVYNDYDWNLVSKEVSLAEGNHVSFGWSFQGGDAKHGNDAAFWILKEVGTGKIVASDLLAQGPTPASGIADIVLPQTGTGQYILTIGQMNVGTYNADQKAGNPHMLLGPVVQDQVAVSTAEPGSPAAPATPLFEVVGDWADGLTGWTPSDPKEQGWQDYLYQFVDTNANLPSWGSCGKITLPPVPEVPGATGKYLYMKDCGEFDTQTYHYDLGFLNHAFGLPVGVKGAAANNFIDNILINEVGIIPGGGKAAQSGSATGNANGLHVYNDYDWNLVSKEIDATNGGVVKFGWSFQGGDAKHGNDAAFWVLKDAVTGEIFSGGVLAQGSNPASGIAEIGLPGAPYSGHYVLTIGQMNVGTYNCDQKAGNPHLLLGSLVLERTEVPIKPMSAALPPSFFDNLDLGAWAEAEASAQNDSVIGNDDLFELGIVGSELDIG